MIDEPKTRPEAEDEEPAHCKQCGDPISGSDQFCAMCGPPAAEDRDQAKEK